MIQAKETKPSAPPTPTRAQLSIGECGGIHSPPSLGPEA
jgi:hypothetical protein